MITEMDYCIHLLKEYGIILLKKPNNKITFKNALDIDCDGYNLITCDNSRGYLCNVCKDNDYMIYKINDHLLCRQCFKVIKLIQNNKYDSIKINGVEIGYVIKSINHDLELNYFALRCHQYNIICIDYRTSLDITFKLIKQIIIADRFDKMLNKYDPNDELDIRVNIGDEDMILGKDGIDIYSARDKEMPERVVLAFVRELTQVINMLSLFIDHDNAYQIAFLILLLVCK